MHKVNYCVTQPDILTNFRPDIFFSLVIGIIFKLESRLISQLMPAKNQERVNETIFLNPLQFDRVGFAGIPLTNVYVFVFIDAHIVTVPEYGL